MTQVSTATRSPKIAHLRLLVEPERWHRVFGRNLRDLLRREPAWHGPSPAGKFWPDVFVPSRLPLRGFLQSGLYHLIAIVLLWMMSHFAVLQAQRVQPLHFRASDVVTYPASEDLPPLNTMRDGHAALRGEPKYAKQEIISVPPEADNTRQTIVTPPDIKLKQDVAVPNIVTWERTSVLVPLSAVKRETQTRIPEIPTSVVAPPPDARAAEVSRNSQSLAAEVIAPPPLVDAASIRKIGDLNIGHSEVVAPAPRLAVSEQRSVNSRVEVAGMAAPSVVAPPPTLGQSSGQRGGGELIALNVEPGAPPATVDPPQGNRRGAFAASPDGKATAAGTPSNQDAGSSGGAVGKGSSSGANSLPSGLYVGQGASSSATAGRGQGAGAGGAFRTSSSGVIASTVPPRVSAKEPGAAEPVPPELTMPLDRKVFGDRKFYAMTQNMPNLNSAGGSWVIRFAELKQNTTPGPLLPPTALRTVDPAYPIELMKNNVAGTVTLYALIHSDGHVSAIRVLDGPDDRLNAYASDALSRWQFQPALKNGEAIAIEAVVRVPFKPRKTRSGF